MLLHREKDGKPSANQMSFTFTETAYVNLGLDFQENGLK